MILMGSKCPIILTNYLTLKNEGKFFFGVKFKYGILGALY